MSRDTFHQPRLPRAPSNLALSTAREGAATASLGNLGQGLTTLTVQNFFLISHLNLPSFSLQPLPLVLSLHSLIKCPSTSFLKASLRYLQAAVRSPRSLLFSRLSSPNSLRLSSYRRCFRPLFIFMTLPWTRSSRSIAFLCWRPPS